MTYNRACDIPENRRLAFAQIGAISDFLAHHSKGASMQLAAIAVWIEPAVLLQQAQIFFNSAGTIAGFVTWAHFCPATEALWRMQGPLPLGFSDWNEEGNLWIISIGAAPGCLRSVISTLRLTPPFNSERTVSWARFRSRDKRRVVTTRLLCHSCLQC